MSVAMAYIGVIIVWSTTPIAIKWSGEEVGFLFGVMSRMSIALAISLLIILIMRKKLPLHKQALHSYFAVGMHIYLSMSCVYWGAQFIPSGLTAVIFGLTPLATSLLALIWLKEQNFTLFRVLAMMIGVVGLVVIFKNSIQIGPQAHWGILGILAAVFFHSLGTVWYKKVGADLPVFAANAGGLLLAVVLYSTTWMVFDLKWPASIPEYSMHSIIYLAVVGSVFGAVLYYYIVKNMETGKVALITFITPVIALMIGFALNDEQLALSTWLGIGLVLTALFFYHWGQQVFFRLIVFANK